MNIVYASNNDYAKYLGISMFSLLDHNQDLKEIIIYILSQEINDENKSKLSAIANRYRRKVEFIDVSQFKKMIPFHFNTSGFHPIVLSRLFLCRYLPEKPPSALKSSPMPASPHCFCSRVRISLPGDSLSHRLRMDSRSGKL